MQYLGKKKKKHETRSPELLPSPIHKKCTSQEHERELPHAALMFMCSNPGLEN